MTDKTKGYEALKRNIIDMLEEQQLKLGYQSEPVYLYYPLSSLNRFLETEADIDEMTTILSDFGACVQNWLGIPEVSNHKDRFCLKIPPQGSDYVHQNLDPESFTAAFIRLIGKHGTDIDSVLALFDRYSSKVQKIHLTDSEFDWLVYFEDGIPDNYRYCITDEGCHLIYHRFTEADYLDMYGA